MSVHNVVLQKLHTKQRCESGFSASNRNNCFTALRKMKKKTNILVIDHKIFKVQLSKTTILQLKDILPQPSNTHIMNELSNKTQLFD